MAGIYFTRPPSGAILAPDSQNWCANMALPRRSSPSLMKPGRRMRLQPRLPQRQTCAWISGPTTKPWADSGLTGHVANPRAPQIPNFETQLLLPTVRARELGAHRGLIVAERERLGAHHAYAIAGARNRNTEPRSQAEEAHNSLSAREAGIAVAGRPSCRAGTEVMASRFLYVAAIWGTRLCDYYFFIKAVRRRLSALNRGIVLETSPANVPPSAVGLGERLQHIIENNRKRIINSTEKASAAIITDASLHG
ncbi:hypothetical protein TCSYLVIO_000287 [Trypanosoma cruzi]|nr:hypothetical protein TCSYLVIO_000287 [Trypanosoma cruzi]